MEHDYFHHLPNLPKLPEKYVDLAKNAKYLFPEEHKMTNRVTLASCLKFQGTKFVNELAQKFSTTIVTFFRNEPYSFYDWHCDLGGVNTEQDNAVSTMLLARTPGQLLCLKIIHSIE
jgi:hypothetical protein